MPESAAPDKQNPVQILNAIRETNLELKVVLMGGKFPIGQLTSLSPGGVLMFEHHSDEPADMYVNGKQVGKGTVVQMGEHFGLRVASLQE